MARRRKNQSDQRLEEEKAETINRLLKKQVSRSRGKISNTTTTTTTSAKEGEKGTGSGDEADGKGEAGAGKKDDATIRLEEKMEPRVMFRYISGKDGLSTLSLPTTLPPRTDEDGTSTPSSKRRTGEVQAYEIAWKGMFGQRQQPALVAAPTRTG